MSDVGNNGKPGGITGKGFTKGKSGNPSGRPKYWSDLREVVRNFLVERDRKERKTRMRVVLNRIYNDKPEILLYYGWGKPIEQVDLTGAFTIHGMPEDLVTAIQVRAASRAKSNGTTDQTVAR